MFSVNNFYDYLTHKYSWPNKNKENLVYKFYQDGGRDLYSLLPTTDFDYVLENNLFRFFGSFYLFDQEPISLETYYFDQTHYRSTPAHIKQMSVIEKNNFILSWLSRMRSPIICHSELNSDDVKLFNDHGFLDVYYWYHGLIARDWFRHYKHYRKNRSHENVKRFGIYARDAGGSRKYRLDLLTKLSDISNEVFFNLQENIKNQDRSGIIVNTWDVSDKIYNSDESSRIEFADTEKFHIQLVAETLFNTTKVHLTEKTFKPIVMEQPFILFSGPFSLDYIKNYGFQTFDSVWDESYDHIIDNEKRFNAVISLINELYHLPKEKFNLLIEKTNNIIAHNKKYFYSQQFEDRLLKEVNDNFNLAFAQQNKNFLSNPGGNWLPYVSMFKHKLGAIDTVHKKELNGAMHYLTTNYPNQAKKILKTYSHLF
jgi:hypothetical protein